MGLAVTGCKSPQGMTTIHGRREPKVSDQPAGLLNPDKGLIAMPDQPGHVGWKEDADTFKGSTVHFDFDSSSIKKGEKSKVSSVADFLKSNASAAVRAEGHCDERGTEEYNRSLGERRALALREELIRDGVTPERVDTISYGEDRPIDPGHNEAAWKQNRRGEFILLTPPK